MSKGYVYILSNPAMPGLIKIGYSEHGGFHRARQLYQTGVAQPFKLEFEIFVSDARAIEQRVHKELIEYRVNDNREFFEISIDDAEAYIFACIIDHRRSAGCESRIVGVFG